VLAYPHAVINGLGNPQRVEVDCTLAVPATGGASARPNPCQEGTIADSWPAGPAAGAGDREFLRTRPRRRR